MYLIEITKKHHTTSTANTGRGSLIRRDEDGIVADTTRDWTTTHVYVYAPNYAPAEEFAGKAWTEWHALYEYLFSGSRIVTLLSLYGEQSTACGEIDVKEALLQIGCHGAHTCTPPTYNIPVADAVKWQCIAELTGVKLDEGKYLIDKLPNFSNRRPEVALYPMEGATIGIYPHRNYKRYGYQVNADFRSPNFLGGFFLEDGMWEEIRRTDETPTPPFVGVLAAMLVEWVNQEKPTDLAFKGVPSLTARPKAVAAPPAPPTPEEGNTLGDFFKFSK